MERNIDMPRIQYRDNLDYAVDIVDRAKPIGSQFAVAAGVLTVLLVAMSAMEVPMQPHELSAAGARDVESPSIQESGLLCSISERFRGWIAVTAS
jgi:hypothetical protein